MSKTKRIWRWMLVASIVAGFGLMAACNTVEGVGKDVEKAGEGIQDAAD